jgi:hypothetical protein
VNELTNSLRRATAIFDRRLASSSTMASLSLGPSGAMSVLGCRTREARRLLRPNGVPRRRDSRCHPPPCQRRPFAALRFRLSVLASASGWLCHPDRGRFPADEGSLFLSSLPYGCHPELSRSWVRDLLFALSCFCTAGSLLAPSPAPVILSGAPRFFPSRRNSAGAGRSRRISLAFASRAADLSRCSVGAPRRPAVALAKEGCGGRCASALREMIRV